MYRKALQPALNQNFDICQQKVACSGWINGLYKVSKTFPRLPWGDGSGRSPRGDLGARNSRSSWRQLGGDRGCGPGCTKLKHALSSQQDQDFGGIESRATAGPAPLADGASGSILPTFPQGKVYNVSYFTV